jgi:hypothetical protein
VQSSLRLKGIAKLIYLGGACTFGTDRPSSLLLGAKHRWMVEGQRGIPRRGRGRPMSQGRTGHKTKRVTGGRGGRQGSSPAFHCALCQLQVNSETQLKQVGEGRLGSGCEGRRAREERIERREGEACRKVGGTGEGVREKG